MSKKETGSLFPAIYSLVFKIPPGHVTTYGQIAREVGCTARTVGFAMAALPSGSDVPWQRVINSQGKISPRQDGEGNVLQRDLLQSEGIYFDQKGKINMEKYNWDIPH